MVRPDLLAEGEQPVAQPSVNGGVMVQQPDEDDDDVTTPPDEEFASEGPRDELSPNGGRETDPGSDQQSFADDR